MSIEFLEAKKSDQEEWNRIVDNTTMGTIFHKWEWLNLIAEELKIKLIPLFIIKDSHVIGILPLFSSRRIYPKIYFSPPPNSFIPFLGPIFNEYDNISNQEKERLMEVFVSSLIKDFRNTALIRIKLHSDLTDVREFLWNKFDAIPIYDYCINLNLDLPIILEKFSKNLRYYQKKLSKDDAYQVKIGSLSELNIIINMVKDRYIQQTKNMPLTLNYFKKIYTSFQNEIKVFTVEYNGDIVGGLITLVYKDIIYLWLGSTNKAKNKSTNDYLYYEVIRWSKTQNIKKFYIIGANTKNINQFKSKYNGDLVLRFIIEKKSFLFKSVYSAYKIFKK